jgi:hypothetical protein
MAMKNILCTILAFIHLCLYSQDLQRKRKSDSFNQETYFINKKDKKKNGPYLLQKTTSTDTLISGNYINDLKAGIWTYYSKSNHIFLKYDYDSKQVVFKSDLINRMDSFYIWENDKFSLQKVESPTIYLGYENQFNIMLAKIVDMPLNLLTNEMSGFSVVVVDINEEGQIYNLTLDKGLDKEFDKNLFKALQSNEGKWLPAIYKGKPAKSRIFIVATVHAGVPGSKKDETILLEKPYIIKVSFLYFKVTREVQVGTRNGIPSRNAGRR